MYALQSSSEMLINQCLSINDDLRKHQPRHICTIWHQVRLNIILVGQGTIHVFFQFVHHHARAYFTLHSKYTASSVLPEPLYTATCDHGQRGRVIASVCGFATAGCSGATSDLPGVAPGLPNAPPPVFAIAALRIADNTILHAVFLIACGCIRPCCRRQLGRRKPAVRFFRRGAVCPHGTYHQINHRICQCH